MAIIQLPNNIFHGRPVNIILNTCKVLKALRAMCGSITLLSMNAECPFWYLNFICVETIFL